MRKDTGGAFWETALDIASVVVSITDVVANPTNATAWISLGAEVASITWKKAANNTVAFIDEYKSMCKYGGPNNRTIKNTNSLNRIWSPGRNYYYKQYGSYYAYGGKTW